MIPKAFTLLQACINAAWELFTGWHIPGTALTPAAFIFFCMAAGFSLKVLVTLFTGAFTESPQIFETETRTDYHRTRLNRDTGTVFKKTTSIRRKK